MPRYKVLKGVAHNIGHSFISASAYAHDDFTMGHILRFARESGQQILTIDLVTGDGEPAELLAEPISNLPHWYTKMFRNMVTNSGSDMALVQSASLTLEYELKRTRIGPNDISQSPYVCDVSIIDTRGKLYSAHFEDWWYVERFIPLTSLQWWNPMTWFSRRQKYKIQN